MKKIYHIFNAHQLHHTIPFIKKFHLITDNEKEFILLGSNDKKSYGTLPLEIQSKITFTGNKILFLLAKIYFDKNSTIILHGFNINFLIINRFAFYKKSSSIWICWGAGLTEKKGVFGILENMLKAWIYNGFDKINVLMKPDAEFLMKHGVAQNKITTIPYPKITKPSSIDNHKKNYGYNILIGNNSSKLNRHIEIMKIIDLCQKKNIGKIITLFGYGGSSSDYKEEVKNFGKLNFGDKFVIHEEMLSLDKYSSIMKDVDIVIIPGIRQTGLGAIYAGLENGSTIYIDKEGKNAEWLNNLGIKYMSIDDLCRTKELAILDQQLVDMNTKKYNESFGEEKITSMWENLIARNKFEK